MPGLSLFDRTISPFPDNPIIRNYERAGTPDGLTDVEIPPCPVCGDQCTDLYKSKETGEIVGCDMCIQIIDAWEV